MREKPVEKLLCRRLSFNSFFKVEQNFNWHKKRMYNCFPLFLWARLNTAQCHHGVYSRAGFQGLGAIILTVAQNSQSLGFGISHPWSQVSVPSLIFWCEALIKSSLLQHLTQCHVHSGRPQMANIYITVT